MPNQIAQLIPVAKSTIDSRDTLTCDARELHAFLGVRRDFSNWIKGRISEYGFIDGTDFVVFAKNGEKPQGDKNLDSPILANQKGHGGDRKSIGYTLTVDMAKELSMVEKNEKGRQIRRYFIECERRARETPPKALPAPEPKARRGRPSIPAHDSIEAKIEALLARVGFYVKEISRAEKEASDLLAAGYGIRTAEKNKSFHDFVIHVACTTSALWAALDFNLRAIEDGIKARLAVMRS